MAFNIFVSSCTIIRISVTVIEVFFIRLLLYFFEICVSSGQRCELILKQFFGKKHVSFVLKQQHTTFSLLYFSSSYEQQKFSNDDNPAW